MKASNFIFNEEGFNNIFPFYIATDTDLVIQSLGKSIGKVYPSLQKGEKLSQFFRPKRPYAQTLTPQIVEDYRSQLVILECVINAELLLRGQFEATEGRYIFIGSPWLTSIEDVKNKNLSIFDFANYDPQLDLLQILKTEEVSTQELKKLLAINEAQKDELKKDKEELNRLSLVASANKNAIVFTHPNAEIFWCNDSYLTITGFEFEDVIGRTPIEVGIHEGIDKEALKEMTTLFYAGETFDVEITHARKDGSCFWTRTTGQPVYDNNGRLLQYFAIIEDTTKEREKDEQLKLLSLIAEKNINAVMICDKHGRVEWVNNSFTEVSGYPIEEIKGRIPKDFLEGPNTDPETVEYLAEKIDNGEPFSCEIVNYTKQGKEYWAKIQGQSLYGKSGEVSRYFTIQEDVTEKKAMEAQKEELLKRLEKSNSDLEDYAQIVSHDLKSPLRSINSLISWIREDNPENFSEETVQYFNLIEGKIEKMDHLIHGILTYSKIDKTDRASDDVDTHKVVNSIIEIIDIPQNITVTIINKLPVIEGDRFRVQQLFQNLIANAVNYIEKPEGLVEIGVEENKSNYIFYVKDNGPGIAEENREKIFKIFQSFTNSEKSTGLGLSIVKKIVDSYKGTISLTSEVGTGTTFYITLPR